MPGVPNPEVVEKAQRRIYTAEYKLRMLQETDTCSEGQIGGILRREGLYSSHLMIDIPKKASAILNITVETHNND